MNDIKSFYINNTKLVNELKKKRLELTDGGVLSVNVSGRKNGREVLTTCMLKGGGIPAGELLLPIDFVILDAVYSLFEAKRYDFTVGDLFAVMTCTRNRSLTEKRSEMLRNELKKLCGINITIVLAYEKQMYMKTRGDAAELPDVIDMKPLLHLDIMQRTVSDKPKNSSSARTRTVTVYHIRSKPVLYKYAEVNQQVMKLTADEFMCAISENGRMTDEAVLVNYWLTHTLRYRRYLKTGSNRRGRYSDISYCGTEDSAMPSLMEWLGYSGDRYFWGTPKGIHKLRAVHRVVVMKLEQAGFSPSAESGASYCEIFKHNKSDGVPIGVSVRFN